MKRIHIFLVITGLLAYSCTPSGSYYISQGEIFHTNYHVKYEADSSLGNSILSKLQEFDNSLNPFNPNSTISRINRNETVVADTFFIKVFNRAQEVSNTSDGAFDITCAPLVNLWGFGFQNIGKATPEVIDSLKEFVSYRKISMADGIITKDDPRIILNCSAIAKGYACDVVARLLDEHGCENYMVEIGGEVRAKGKNPHGECWRIEISKPIDDTTGIISERQEVIELCNKSMATSGNYRNFYIRDGKKYAHTINPKTGYPAESDMLSATVLAADCMTADAYATVFMVLGTKKSRELIETLNNSGRENLQCYFIFLNEEGKYDTMYFPPQFKK